MAAIGLTDFQDIYTAVLEILGVQATDTTQLNRIKRDINMIYVHEVVPIKRWHWLTGNTRVVHAAYYGGGTVTVTPDSATVTLGTAPATSLGSFAGYRFSVDGFDEVYEVSAHTAGATTLTLTSTYQGALNSAAAWKVWRDRVDLPTDAKETFEVWHDRRSTLSGGNMKGVGRQEFRKIEGADRKAQDFPYYYSTTDFYDPSTGDAETESDRYRQMLIYPAVNNEPVTLNIDYIKQVAELELDADEPVMPIEDRIVLVYGAASRAFLRFGTNIEAAQQYQGLYEAKLARMMGNVEDSPDMPSITPKSRYLQKLRSSRTKSIGRGGRFAGSGSYQVPTYAKDITIEGATLTANMDVNAGITIDGRDISVDGTTLDSISTLTAGISTANRVVITDASALLDESAITSTELTYLNDFEPLTPFSMSDNQASAATVASWTVASFDTIFIDYSISRGSANKETGTITLATDGSSAVIAQGGIADIGTIGVTFTADVSSGSLRLRYTSTSTGTAPSMKYIVRKWLA